MTCTKSITLTNGNTSPLPVCDRNIIQKALAALTLLGNNLLSNSYPLCRGMIGQYIKTLMLQRHPEALDAYAKFRENSTTSLMTNQNSCAILIAETKNKHF